MPTCTSISFFPGPPAGGRPGASGSLARRKGIQSGGNRGFHHPGWRQELQEKLEPAEEGLYTLRPSCGWEPGGRTPPRFVVTGESAPFIKRTENRKGPAAWILLPLGGGGGLSRRWRLSATRSDGRPILGLDCRDLLELTLETCRKPCLSAHIWSLTFLFGAFFWL